MKLISATILDLKEPKCEEATKLGNLDIDYMHLDVMDGIFVENVTYTADEFYEIVKYVNKPKEVHLMVSDVKKSIDDFARYNPAYITFHVEAVSEVSSVINYIRERNIKVGIAIRPSTEVSEIVDYLDFVDLVLVMSVEPGKGGQPFIEDSVRKINQLKSIRDIKGYKYMIEVDGGINDVTMKLCENADILAVGSFITKNNYEEAIKKLRE